MSTSRAVGIDLGAARAVVARVDQHGRSLMFRDAQGDSLIPSVVYFEDDEPLVGRPAKLAAATGPSRAAEFYKRDLGQTAYARAIGGELLPPELVEACLIKRHLSELQASGAGADAVVLSLPASFNQSQRRARLDAARLAGANVIGTIHDPLAAALTYAESQGYLAPDVAADKPGQRVLVFDLGASKFDAAIIEIKPGRLRTMSVGGNMNLGGRDWDARLAEYLAEQFAKQFGEDPRHDMVSVRRLLESAEDAKQSLTARQQARVQVQRGEDSAAIIVTRQALEDLAADLLDDVMRNIESVLGRAGLAWRDLAGALVVGGATRMPAVAARLKKLTGHDPATSIHPDEAVARGAALYAEHLLAAREGRPSPLKLSITDMTLHSLGMRWHDAQTSRWENVSLISRGSELPCGTVAHVATDVDDQSTIELELLEGESRVADQCVRIADLSIRDLPAALPVGTQVNVQYQFTAEGRLQVKAQLARTGQALPISLRRANSQSDKELADWQQVIAQGGGLTALRSVAARHEAERQERAEAAAAAAPSMPPPVNLGAGKTSLQPPELPAEGVAPGADFSLDADPGLSHRRLQRRRMTPRKLVILIGGYVVSALLGTAIGYYILMRIDPSYNYWDLRLPGLQAPPTGALSTESQPRVAVESQYQSGRCLACSAPFAPSYRRPIA